MCLLSILNHEKLHSGNIYFSIYLIIKLEINPYWGAIFEEFIVVILLEKWHILTISFIISNRVTSIVKILFNKKKNSSFIANKGKKDTVVNQT